jgi:hypothetical protein
VDTDSALLYEIGAIQCAEKTNSTYRKSLVFFVSFIEKDTNDWLKDEPTDLTCPRVCTSFQ